MVTCFFGDSLTLGYGDESGLGWPGRITATLMRHGIDATGYNLGVRKDTSIRLQKRWQTEAKLRMLDGVDFKLVFSLGVADIMNDIPIQDSLAAVKDIVCRANAVGTVLFIGPTPVLDTDKSVRIKQISGQLENLCSAEDIPFIPTFDSMEGSAVYGQALGAGDTVHPLAAGYAALAEHILQHNAARNFFGLEQQS